MGSKAENFVRELMKKDVFQRPSDTVKEEDLVMKLPSDFDENKFNRGKQFYWDHVFSLAASMMVGLVAVLAIPSILGVLVSSRRSSSTYTAYKRYVSTVLHVDAWFRYDLKPGSVSWRSLYEVRSRHVRASSSAKLKGVGIISQRDLAITMFGFMGFSVVKPDHFGIAASKKGDWDAYVYFWRVIGHMIGLEDRYNICRDTYDETRAVCMVLQQRVFRPCMESPPEYFEHMARVLLDGLSCLNITIEPNSVLFVTKRLCQVPGYVYTEEERLNLRQQLKDQLNERSEDVGVEVTNLMPKPYIEIPDHSPRLLYLRDYDTIQDNPVYKSLPAIGKFKSAVNFVTGVLYSTFLGRWYFNINYYISLYLISYFPYLAFIKFGVRASYVNFFAETPVDDTRPKPNSEYYTRKPSTPWYKEYLNIF